MSLERVRDGYRLIDEQGRPLVFPWPHETEMPVGGRIISYGANMELIRHADHFTVEHWHHGMNDLQRFSFAPVPRGPMLLRSLENLSGHRIRIEHDNRGRPIRLVQEIEERVVELGYGEDDLIASAALVLDNGSRQTLVRYIHDGQRRLVSAIDATGNRTSYEYDEHHRMVRETNVLGTSFHFRYDDRGRCSHSYGDGGYMERRLRYFSSQGRIEVTDSVGNLTKYYINANGLVIQQVSPLGATTTTEYDEFGRPISIRNSLGGQLRYEYDGAGNRSAVIHEDGGRSEMTYNAFHMLRSYTSPSGATWHYDFSSRGEVIMLTSPTGERRSAVRDSRGLVTETRSPTGVRVQRRYGPNLRWVEASDAISLLSRVEYDERGNQTAIFDAQGLVQRISYDALARPIRAQDRAGRSYRMSWNALGELVEQSGPDVAWERRTYDGFGQLVQHDNPLGTLRIAYDKEGRITRVHNRANEELTWVYDADSWLIQETGFDGRVERYEYDIAGRPVRLIRGDGRVISREFDVCGQMVRRALSEDDIEELAYDADGSLVMAKNRFAEVVLERNQSGRVIAEVQNGRRVEYAYDADGDRSGRRIIGVESVEIRLARDARKRLVSLADNSGVRIELKWDDVNRPIERRFARDVRERLVYDSIGRLREQKVSSPQPGAQVERRYDYDQSDNLVARQDLRHGQSTFGHDEIGRLTTVSAVGDPTEHYAYDANGAIIETHRGRRILAGGGRTLVDGSRRYSYAMDGCVRQIDDQGRTTLFEHNTEGQITRVQHADATVVRYEYDPFGRRTAKEIEGVRTEFIWDGPVLAAEFRPGEPTNSHYILGFEPLIQWKHRQPIFPVRDQSGLMREAFDDNGALLWHAKFDAYGSPQFESGPRCSQFAFRGQYVDNEVGLHYNFFRSYSPLLGDYTAPDPIGVEGGTHFYAYPRNPLQCDDPFGLKCGGAACGEKSMDGYFGQKGYKKVGAIGKNPNSNGIDAIYHNPNGKPPYIIAEAKNRGGYLHTDQHGNAQMSDAWINSPAGNASQKRLDAAFPPGSPHPAAIRAASANGDVHTAVYNPEKSPKVTNYGTYGGPNSTDQNAPPRTPNPLWP
jgi:RHS repeat-associated protein